jgi:histidyl-tRNA synthetase
MTEEKALDPSVADKIGEFVILKGSRDLLAALQSNPTLTSNASSQKGLADIELLFTYLEAFNILDKVSFDLSLARGLDYYTGVIFEVTTEGSAPPSTPLTAPTPKSKKKLVDPDDDRSSDPSIGVGSVAAGGRYDELVGMFSGKTQIPCVGISFGVDRIFSITKARMDADSAVRSNEVDVYVMAFGGKGFTGLLKERMEVARLLWDAGIKAEFAYKVKPKLPAQFKAAEIGGVPFAVILGEDEQAAGKVKVKELGLPEGHPEKDGVLVDLSGLATDVRKRLERKEKGHSVEEVAETVKELSVEGKDHRLTTPN